VLVIQFTLCRVSAISRYVVSSADHQPELSHQLENTGARVVFVHPTMLDTARAAAKKCGLPEDRIFLFADRPCRPQYNIVDWRELIGTPEEADSYDWKSMTPSEAENSVATVNFSSGTTGLPKGVCISHYNLVANAEQHMFVKYHETGQNQHNHSPERMVGFLPLYHAYGQMWAMIMVVKLNIPIHIMEKFQFDEFLRVIQTYKITHLQVAPPILVMLSKRLETAKYDISSVKHILCGAAPLSKDLQNDITRRFGARVTQGWGMTEVTTGALFVPFSVDDE
jgi:4-coumarate--CoA ligase